MLPYFEKCSETASEKLLELYLYAKKKGLDITISNEIEAYRKLAWMQRTGRLPCIVNYEVAVRAYHLFLDKLRRTRPWT